MGGGRLKGKVALVTGGASGIGRATARALAAEGATLIVADVDEAGGEAVAREVDGEFARLDVADPDAWRGLCGELTERHGGLDIAYLNAGVTTYPATGEEFFGGFEIADLPDENYRRIMGVNVDGVVFGARSVVPAMEARGGGAIVATASAAGVIDFPPDPVYTMTKHAVVGFVRALSPWLRARGIRLNAVLPGIVDTNILADGFAEQAREMGLPVIPAEQIADAVLELVGGDEAGGLWLCLANAPPTQYRFAPVEGLGVPDTEIT